MMYLVPLPSVVVRSYIKGFLKENVRQTTSGLAGKINCSNQNILQDLEFTGPTQND